MRRLGCSVLVAVAATTNPSLQERLNTSLSSIYLIKGKRLRRVWGGVLVLMLSATVLRLA